MAFNLGNFGGQLNMDDVNGALQSTGAGFGFDAQGQEQPTAAPAQTAAAPAASKPFEAPELKVPEQEPEAPKQNILGKAIGLVASYFTGGAAGAAMSAVGSMGGKK